MTTNKPKGRDLRMIPPVVEIIDEAVLGPLDALCDRRCGLLSI